MPIQANGLWVVTSKVFEISLPALRVDHSLRYHLPAHLVEHVDYITPGVKSIMLRKRNSKNALNKRGWKPGHGSPGGPWQHLPPPFMMPKGPGYNSLLNNCSMAVTPACIAALYRVPPGSKAHPGNSLGIFEEGDTYAQTGNSRPRKCSPGKNTYSVADLDLFFSNFTPYIPQGTHPILNSIDGGHAPVDVTLAGGESDLDFQLAYPLVYPQTITLYQVDDDNYNNGGM